MQIGEFQQYIKDKYYEVDNKRGTAATFMWFIEEVGELATGLAGNDRANKIEEFGDVIAWLCTLANINDIDLEEAVQSYVNKNHTTHK